MSRSGADRPAELDCGRWLCKRRNTGNHGELAGGGYWRRRSELRPTISLQGHRETMEVAARGWEQLTEELEHRLKRTPVGSRISRLGPGRTRLPQSREKNRSGRQNRSPD